MPCGPISYENLTAASKTHDPSKPVYLLNLWRFREQAEYRPEHAHLAGEPCTGREALQRYVALIRTQMPPGTAIFFNALPVAHVVAPESEKWDYVALNLYPAGLKGFQDMVESERYRKEIEPHRLAGLEDFRLVMLDQIEVPSAKES